MAANFSRRGWLNSCKQLWFFSFPMANDNLLAFHAIGPRVVMSEGYSPAQVNVAAKCFLNDLKPKK